MIIPSRQKDFDVFYDIGDFTVKFTVNFDTIDDFDVFDDIMHRITLNLVHWKY